MKRFLVIGIFLVLVIIFLNFHFELLQVAGSGMEPELRSGQYVLFRKYFGQIPSPKRGDIVTYTFDKNLGSGTAIGRVIGLSSESVRIQNSNIYIENLDGQYRLEEVYLGRASSIKALQENEWVKIGKFDYLILKNSPRTQVNLFENMINRNNIKEVLFFKF